MGLPFILLGSAVAMMQPQLKLPGHVHAVPNIIPQQPWYLNKKYLYLITGLVPFLAIALEIYYLMMSIWKHYFYNLFGFLLMSSIVLFLLSSLISILVIHHQLNKGDYRWWWKSFLVAGSNSIYFILFSIYYFFNLKITRFATILIYFSTMTLFSMILFLSCGSIGFIATFFYVRAIYTQIKID